MTHQIEEIENPKRLAIDLIGVRSPKYMKATVAAQTFPSIRVGQHKNKSRIVVDTYKDKLTKNVGDSKASKCVLIPIKQIFNETFYKEGENK